MRLPLRVEPRPERQRRALPAPVAELAAISERRLDLAPEALDLNQVVTAAEDMVREPARDKSLQMVVRLWDSPLWLSGDPTRLNQMVGNILNNAIRYTDPGGVITVTTRRLDGEAEVAISDTGCGIAPQFLDLIFQPFRRSTDDWLTSESGLGLGLAIARRIVAEAPWPEDPEVVLVVRLEGVLPRSISTVPVQAVFESGETLLELREAPVHPAFQAHERLANLVELLGVVHHLTFEQGQPLVDRGHPAFLHDTVVGSIREIGSRGREAGSPPP